MAALARRLALVLLTTIMVLGVMAPGAVAGSHETDALALLNAERASAGLPPVAVHSDLVDDALAWSQQMLQRGSLSHNPNLAAVTADWDKLGENVGVGTSIAALHEAFMDSPGHRGNILGDYDYVGIAVVEETSSKLWITVVFMKSLEVEPITTTGDDPEPYSAMQPAVDNDQPVASPATTRVAAATPTPAAQPAVAVMQKGLWQYSAQDLRPNLGPPQRF